MNFLENLSVVWQKLNLVQRAILMAILVAGGITAVFLTKWASKPNMYPLYSNVSPEDAGKISDKLAEKGIPFELRGPGTIYVPKEEVYQLRGVMAKDGLPTGGSQGYKLFDEGKFGASPFTNNVNFTRAIQDEIARSIQLFDNISTARVHIVRPKQSPFKDSEQNATASVILQVKPGYVLDSSTVAAITHMVAGSVEDLKNSGVTLVDSQGRLLSDNNTTGTSRNARNGLFHKTDVERQLAENVQNMLETFLGPGRCSVIVSAEVDMNHEEVTKTTYLKGVPTSEKINTITKTVSSGNDKEGNPLGSGEEEGEEVLETTYVTPTTQTTTIKAAGEIKSISVSCVVDLTITPEPVAVKEGETAPPPAAPKKIMKVEKVEALILNALAKNNLTKENLTVEDIPFIRPKLPEAIEEPAYMAYVDLLKQGSLGIMAVCALLAMKIFSGKVKSGKGGSMAQLPDPEMSAVAALPAGDMRDQIALAYKSDPDQVKELFTSWLEEKG